MTNGFQKNLEIVEEAIAEVRRALEEDPGNPHLEQQLLAHHRQEIDLLRHLAAPGSGRT